jgi:hypothetical protein
MSIDLARTLAASVVVVILVACWVIEILRRRK